MENSDKSIVSGKRNKSNFLERAVSIFRKKGTNLPLAREILQKVVETSEETLTEETDFSRIGIYSTKQLWEAVRVITLDVIIRNGGSMKELKSNSSTIVSKSTKLGQLSLAIYQLNNKPTDVTLQLGEDRDYIIQSSVPILKPNAISSFFTRFYDKRSGVDTFKSAEGIFDLQTMKLSWRGLRWLCANILDWNGQFKLPEDLDNNITRLNPPQ